MKKLYVLTRNDLPIQYAAVQAGHGVAQYLLDNPGSAWHNEYLIFLAVKDERELDKVLFRLKYKKAKVSIFKEPDLDNQLTSIAVYSDEKVFKKFKLLAP